MAEHSTSAKALTDHEPVLDEAAIAGKVTAGVTAVVAIAGLAGAHWDASRIDQAALGVLAAGCVAVNWCVPRWRAWRARHVVTALADPHNAAGEQLVTTASVLRAQTAAAAARVDDVPDLADTPLDESATIVRTPA